MTKYITNFTKGCFHHWSASKAVMELVQNWLDSDGEREYEFGDNHLILTNKNIRVSNKMLLTGKSDKRNDDTKRGQFGVGSIQALVVLTDLDIQVVIHNNDVIWKPSFEYCDKFDDYIMVIEEQSGNNGQNFTVEIQNLSETDIDEIKQRCLMFQDREVLQSTQYGDVIDSPDGVGEVFCGDIYVCQNNSFKYSYNFKPKGIKLSQDRDAVSQWDLQELTAKLIIATKDDDFIVNSIKMNSLDTSNVNRWYEKERSTPSSVNDKMAEEFLEQHGAVIVTSDYSEHEQHTKLGNKSVYIQNETVVKAIRNSETYQEAISKLVYIEKESFRDLFENLFDNVVSLMDNSPSQYVPEGLSEQLEELAKRVRNKEFD